MGPRLRKLIGGLAMLVFLALYVALAVTLVDYLPRWGWLKGLYFIVIGVGWGIPLIPLLTWMDKGKWR